MGYFQLVYGPVTLGALVAVVVAIGRGRFTLFRPGAAGLVAIVAAIVVIGLSLPTSLLVPGGLFPDLFLDGRMAFTLSPLIVGVLGAVILAFTPAPDRTWQAELTPRSPVRIGPRRWFLVVAVTLTLIVLATLWAGALSSPDEQGRYRVFEIQPSTSIAFGGEIYGWYYSKWALPVILGLLLLGAWRLYRITAGPGSEGVRRAHNRVILAMIAGALLLHLGQILSWLSGVGFLHGGATFGGQWLTFESSLAALTVPLMWAARIVTVLGWGAWFTVLFSPAPPRGARSKSPSSVSEGY